MSDPMCTQICSDPTDRLEDPLDLSKFEPSSTNNRRETAGNTLPTMGGHTGKKPTPSHVLASVSAPCWSCET